MTHNAPKIIYEGTGLKIVKNALNSFIVVTLHHTADPTKRSIEWRREAAQGMTPEKFAREYDIDYTAVLGAKVFPEITSHRDAIVCDPFDITGTRCWAGFDYGTRNPSSFHVYTILDGVTYSIWELYEPCRNIGDFAAKLKECPYWSRIRYVAADPSCWSPTQQQATGQPVSVAELFYRAGIHNLLKGRNDGGAEDAWTAMIHDAWHDPKDIKFKVFASCPNQIHEFEVAVYVAQSERQLLTASMHERINDKDNHTLDDCKYYMLSRPTQQQAQSSQEYVNMVDRWSTRPSSPTRRRTEVRGYR